MTSAPGVTLALDASTYTGSVAVLRDGALVAERAVAMRGETEERLMPAVLDALRAADASPTDVQRVICGAGPGSFTSLRIAGSIAKGIAFGNRVPLYTVSSLALVVAGADDLAAGKYLAALDAMRGDRYVLPVCVGADGSLEELVTAIDPSRRTPYGGLVPADAVAELAARLGAAPIGPLELRKSSPHARGVARLLGAVLSAPPVDLDTWEPLYGRVAEAQARWEAEHGRPLAAP